MRLKEKTPEKQEKELEAFARQKKCWFGTEKQTEQWNFIGSGCEAQVYEDEDITKIRKVINHSVYSDTPQDFLDFRIDLYNFLFPETAYELLGFARVYGEFSFVVKQPFIEGRRLEIEEISQEMIQRGFRNEKYFYYINEHYILEDLHQGNVLKDKDGNIFFIDTIPSFSSGDTMDHNHWNSYYIQRSRKAQESVRKMAEKPLSLEQKKAQTTFILESLYQ